MMSSTRHFSALACAMLLGMGPVIRAQAQAAPIVIAKQSDLPRFSYPMTGTATRFVESSDTSFNAFAGQVRHDIDDVLGRYRIDDPSTLSELLLAKLDLQELAGDYAGGLATITRVRALQQKPAAKLLTALPTQARLEAAIDAGGESGAAYEAAYKTHYAAAIAPLPWAVVQDEVKASFGLALIASRAALVSHVTTELDPAVAKSGALDAAQAYSLIRTRVELQHELALDAQSADMMRAYIAKNEVPRPDIWTARELTLTEADKLTPVKIGIWDSGVDVTLFPDQLFTDPTPTASGTHGLAFDDEGEPSKDWTYPLSAAQQAAYPRFQQLMRGWIDLQHGTDTADARASREMFRTMSPEQMHDMEELNKVLGFYAHGTHCAGIAVRGNPAARLVVARFDDQLPDFPFAPTEAWVRKMGADFQQMADYFRTRQVRVVNLSWEDDEQEFETWLSKTGGGADTAERKKKAAQLFSLWRSGVASAIRSAPDTLFVAAAGNSDSDAGFIEAVPSGLELPNLIAVGAVNKSGDETSFTSHGKSVVVYGDGFEVFSVVPGGARMAFSGTSMAAPNVVNLAAKLMALDPKLTPRQTIALIRNGATPTEDGRRQLIDEKRSAALLAHAQDTSR